MKEEPNLTRREFLEKSAAIAGGIFLAWLSLSEEALAKLEDLLAMQEFIEEDFQKTLLRLKREVYENNKEVLWAHIKKGGREYAVNIIRKATEAMVESVDLARLYEDKDVERICLAHTHPIKMLMHHFSFPKEKAENVFREKRSDYPLMPSGTDFIDLLANKIAMQEQSIKCEPIHFLVEPSGVWRYDVDPGHPFWKENIRPSEEGSLAASVRSSSLLRLLLDGEFANKEKEIFESDGMKEDDFQKLKEWAKKEYGISLDYKKFQ